MSGGFARCSVGVCYVDSWYDFMMGFSFDGGLLYDYYRLVPGNFRVDLSNLLDQG